MPGVIDGRSDWHPGYDPRLSRAVWIRRSPPARRPSRRRGPPCPGRHVSVGSPAAAPIVTAWDVFEAVAGRPLSRALDDAWDWATARQWLADMARELAAQGSEVPPPLDPDRVWVLDTGRAKLLDDPTAEAPAAPGPPPSGRLTAAVALLIAVARLARAGGRQPWPVTASHFAARLSEAPPASLTEVAQAADALLRGRAAVTRGLRIVSLAALVAFPMLMGGMVVGGMLMLSRQARSVPVQTRVAAYVLRELDRRNDPKELGPADRDAAEIVLASRYRSESRRPDPLRARALPAPAPPRTRRWRIGILRRPVDRHAVDAAAARPAVRSMLDEGARFDLPPISGVALHALLRHADGGGAAAALVDGARDTRA